MRRAHELLTEKPGVWTRPAGIKAASSVDAATFAAIKSKCTGAQVGNVCGYGQSDLFPSWYSPVSTSSAKKAVIDTISGKLATECTPELAKKEVTGGKIQPEIPATDPNYKNWLEPIVARFSGISGIAIPVDKDDRHLCSDAKPSTTISVSKLGTGYYRFSATVSQGLAQLKTLSFKIDGQTVSGGSFGITSPGVVTMDYFSEITGSHAVSAQVVDDLLYEYTTSGTSQTFDAVPTITVSKTGVGPTTTASWTAISWADSYYYTITNSSGTVVDSGSTSGTSRSMLALPNGTYSVVVDAYLGSSLVKSSAATSITKP